MLKGIENIQNGVKLIMENRSRGKRERLGLKSKWENKCSSSIEIKMFLIYELTYNMDFSIMSFAEKNIKRNS